MGTLCSLGCPSDSRLKSKDWSPLTWGRVFLSPAPRTETSPYGAEEQCWPTCAPSALHGLARKNMRSMVRRLSSGRSSECFVSKVCMLNNNELGLCHRVQLEFCHVFFAVALRTLWSQFTLVSVDPDQWVDLLLVLCLLYWDPPRWWGWCIFCPVCHCCCPSGIFNCVSTSHDGNVCVPPDPDHTMMGIH